MTRLELLKILIGQARDNGFEFRRWYTARLALPWTTADDAFLYLEKHRCYYSLLFSHEFARAFWKAGAPLTFQVPSQSFTRRMADGSIRVVTRKAFMRRTTRADVWRYHLREMAAADEPLRYMRKFLAIKENLQDSFVDTPADAAEAHRAAGLGHLTGGPAVPSPATQADAAQPAARPVPATLALARKTHERRQNARSSEAVAARKTQPSPGRSPRLPRGKQT